MLNMLRYFLTALNPSRRKQWLLLLGMVLVTAVVELAALGLVALFITSLTSLDQILLSRYAAFGRQVFGEALFNDPRLLYLALGGATIGMMALKNLLLGVQYYASSWFEGALSADAGTLMLRSFLACPYEWSSRQNSADVHSQVQWRTFVGYLPSNLIQIISDGAISLLLLGSLFFFEPLLSLGVLVVLGGVGGGIFLLCKERIGRYGCVNRDLFRANIRESLRNVQGMREIKVFNAEDRSLALFNRQLRNWTRNLARQKMLERSPVWILETVGVGGIVLGAILMICFKDYSNAHIMGTLSLVAISAWRILPSISRCVGTLGSISGYLPNLRKVRDFMETMRKQLAKAKTVTQTTLPLLSRGIVIHELEYTYPESSRKALRGINLTIRKGSTIGIIGHSGAGKSTLADLLAGFLEPGGGSVRIDDTVLDAGTASSWRDQLGIVPQQPFFFEGSLRENIAMTFSQAPVDGKRLAECCALAGVDEFLYDLPEGLDTPMGERGARLSGGQIQRVAIARALYRDPQVLIFDEATSALDDANEDLVRKTILGLKGKSTILIIAHRLRTIEQCDRIVWLKQGRVVACGSPAEILPRFERNGETPNQTMEVPA